MFKSTDSSMKKPVLFLCSLIMGVLSIAQEIDLNTATIPEHLLENADAVVRKNVTKVVIENYDEYEVTTDRIITVLNSSGMSDVNAYQYYDNFIEIKDISAVIYDESGNKIDKIKQKDFKDVSAVSNGTLYSDSRRVYLDYTPRSYPVTIHLESEVVFNSTAFFPSWYPVEGYRVSTEYTSYSIENDSDEVLKIKESNFDTFAIEKTGEYSYQAKDLVAFKPQSASPSFSAFAPHVLVALERFKMEGVDGENTDWQTFGKWMHDKLLVDVGEIPESVKQEVRQLVQGATSEREKAAIIYKYMQDRSRYISVQVGIGGWKPIEAVEVHEKAYGDCKGLTNYTKSLLTEVGITAEYAVIYGDRNIRDIDREFSSTQGNHVILYIPQLDDEKDIWLECTSKTNPFGYIAGFTDDRDALVVNEEGGKIVHTTKYLAEESQQLTTANLTLLPTGAATGSLEMITTGYQYSMRDNMFTATEKDAKRSYQRRWDNLNGLVIDEVSSLKDTDKVEFTESVSFKVEKLATKMGDLLLLSPVLFNKSNYEPPSYEERLYDLDLDRGYVDLDEYTITLDPSLQVDAIPEPVAINSEFGSYELSISSVEGNQLKVRRYLKINDGTFSKEKYADYEKFRTEIVKYDDSKAALKLIK